MLPSPPTRSFLTSLGWAAARSIPAQRTPGAVPGSRMGPWALEHSVPKAVPWVSVTGHAARE